MITFTPTELGISLIIFTSLISWVAYMVGYHKGEKDESDRIIDYCITHSMNVKIGRAHV